MAAPRGEEFIRHRSAYLVQSPYGLTYYEQWVDDESERDPKFPGELRASALELINDKDETVRLSALQALACVGTIQDINIIKTSLTFAQDGVQVVVSAAIDQIHYRNKSLQTLLSEVMDRKSFVLFARALAKDWDLAQKEENANPDKYTINGAHGWNNSDISSFIYSGLTAFEDPSSSETISWEGLAQFLLLGKELE